MERRRRTLTWVAFVGPTLLIGIAVLLIFFASVESSEALFGKWLFVSGVAMLGAATFIAAMAGVVRALADSKSALLWHLWLLGAGSVLLLAGLIVGMYSSS